MSRGKFITLEGVDMLLLDKSLESWQKLLDVNLTGVMLTDRAVARAMIAGGNGGTIVNIASVAAVTALLGSADYCVSKAGVWMLTKCYALELARHRIRVNAVGPGYIKTSMSGAAITHQPWVDSQVRRTPLRRCPRLLRPQRATTSPASPSAPPLIWLP